MSDQELYQIAQQRIRRRNRRWTIWAFDLAGLIMTVAGLIFFSDTPYVNYAVGIMIAWAGVFTLHTIVAAMNQSQDEDIEKEIAKLREAAGYEKPKRLQLTEDGEVGRFRSPRGEHDLVRMGPEQRGDFISRVLENAAGLSSGLMPASGIPECRTGDLRHDLLHGRVERCRRVMIKVDHLFARSVLPADPSHASSARTTDSGCNKGAKKAAIRRSYSSGDAIRSRLCFAPGTIQTNLSGECPVARHKASVDSGGK